MNKLIKWLNESFAPKMNKINTNIWVLTLKDSIMQILPFILLGSVFCLLTLPAEIFGWVWFYNFWTPFGWTMGMVSILVAFLIPFNLMEKKRMRKQRLIAGMSGLILHLIIVSPQVIADGEIGFGHSALGAGGMFVAIIAGLFAGWVMSLFAKFSFFKEDSVIPEFVRVWFDSMLPIAIVLVSGWLLCDVFAFDLYNTIQAIFMPLQKMANTPLGMCVVLFIGCFLYSMGISTWVLSPITSPVELAAITSNMALAAAGTATTANLSLFTSTTIYSTYLWVGGIGCTLPLVIMCMLSKSKKLKALGTACLVPGIFNINEPIVFGAIAWNPYLMIPMWLQAIVLPLVMWVGTKIIPFAPIPVVQFEMWYCPFPLATWFTTQSFTAVILLLIIVAVSTAIWYPFFRAYEKTEIEAEQKAIEA